MCIVNVRYGLVLRRQVDDVFEGGDVSVHAEDSVRNDENPSKTISVLQLLFEVAHVFVFVDSPLGLGHSTAVDDASMVELIADDEVPIIYQGEDRSRIRSIARLKRDRCFGTSIIGENLLELQMHVHSARDNSYRPGPGTILSCSRNRSLLQLWMISQSQIVIGA